MHRRQADKGPRLPLKPPRQEAIPHNSQGLLLANANRSYYDEWMITSPPPTPPGTPTHPVPASVQLPVSTGPQWRSEELLAGSDEALITHGDQVYRLRRTGTGKLILTK